MLATRLVARADDGRTGLEQREHVEPVVAEHLVHRVGRRLDVRREAHAPAVVVELDPAGERRLGRLACVVGIEAPELDPRRESIRPSSN